MFVERLNRKWLLVLCDFATAAVYFCLLLAPEASGLYLPLLLAGTILVNIIARAFDIGSKLIFSELLDHAVIEKYNGVKSICDNTATVVAPALGTIVFNLWGFKSVLLVVSAAYALSALQECLIVYRRVQTEPEGERQSWLRRFWEGLVYVKEEKSLRFMFLLAMMLNFFLSNGDEIIYPGIIMQKYQIPDNLYGLTSSAFATGTILAGFLIYRNKRIDLNSKLPLFVTANSVILILLGVLSLVMTPWPMTYFVLFVLGQFLLGVFVALVNVPLFSGFQTQVPLRLQGRFFALLSVGSGLLIPLGISYTGFLAELLGADTACIINNACVIAGMFLCGGRISVKNKKEGGSS